MNRETFTSIEHSAYNPEQLERAEAVEAAAGAVRHAYESTVNAYPNTREVGVAALSPDVVVTNAEVLTPEQLKEQLLGVITAESVAIAELREAALVVPAPAKEPNQADFVLGA